MKKDNYRASVNINVTVNSSNGYINYGVMNDMPEVILDLISRSSVARACINLRTLYANGLGFVNKELGNTVVDAQEQTTLQHLYNQCMTEYQHFNGFVLLVDYNVHGKVARVRNMPVECFRLGVPDENGTIHDIKYKDIWNPQRGQRAMVKKPISYDIFNPKRRDLMQRIADSVENGEEYTQCFFARKLNPGARAYPIPSYLSGDWIGVDGEISRFHYANLLSGMFGSAIVTFVGKYDGIDPVTGLSQRQKIELDFKNLVGSDNAGTVQVHFAPTKEELPQITRLAVDQNGELFKALQELATTNICVSFQVPEILIGVKTAGRLGQSQEIINAHEIFYNNVIIPDQRWVMAELTKVLANFVIPLDLREEIIERVPVLKSIPSELYDVLTTEEKRALIGYDTLPQQIKSAEDDATDTIVAVFADTQNFNYLSSKPTNDDIAGMYVNYFSTVNMTATELVNWSETVCSKKLGTSRVPLMRTIELLNINKSDWTEKHYRWAMQLIRAIERLKALDEGSPIQGCKYDRRGIALKNLGYDIHKI